MERRCNTMRSLKRNDWVNILKILATIIASILGTLGVESFDSSKFGI